MSHWILVQKGKCKLWKTRNFSNWWKVFSNLCIHSNELKLTHKPIKNCCCQSHGCVIDIFMTGQGCVRCLQFCYGNLNLCTLTGSSILFYSKISSIQLFLLSVTDVILAQLLDFVDGSINVPLGFFFFFFPSPCIDIVGRNHKCSHLFLRRLKHYAKVIVKPTTS